ncbi:hypothetical protein KY290_035039 [Solanum tuberosum]|uniref:Uncharacterized protein n=1 Tax=Solanum tuberosum TaxID=4113 RepID=A0ABQ7U5C2_SOLTU|nr:hypothetical protein KY290_035039 [Solanum tuberosum]
MVHDKQVKDVVSGWLTVFDDGSVDRTWTGPPEVKFMAEPVPPHDDFIDGVAVKDVVAGENSGSRFRIYLPERNDSSVDKLPVILHFHGGEGTKNQVVDHLSRSKEEAMLKLDDGIEIDDTFPY